MNLCRLLLLLKTQYSATYISSLQCSQWSNAVVWLQRPCVMLIEILQKFAVKVISSLFWIDALYYFDVQVLEPVQGGKLYFYINRRNVQKKKLASYSQFSFIYIYVSDENQIKAGQLNVMQAFLEVMIVHKADSRVVQTAADALHRICKNGFNNNKWISECKYWLYSFFKHVLFCECIYFWTCVGSLCLTSLPLVPGNFWTVLIHSYMSLARLLLKYFFYCWCSCSCSCSCCCCCCCRCCCCCCCFYIYYI